MDKSLLLKARLPEANVTIDGVGTVRVRGLSRAEVVGMQNMAEDLPGMERAVLTAGLVDPVLFADEVAQWYASAPSEEIALVIMAIRDLSGLAEGAAKAAYKSVPGES